MVVAAEEILRVLELEDTSKLNAEVFAVICKVPAVTVPINTSVFDVVLVFVIEERVKPVVPRDIIKSLADTVGLNGEFEVTTIEAPASPVAIGEDV